MKRKDEIETDLGVLEAVIASDPERLESWMPNAVERWRREFDRLGDLNDRQFETLQNVRHKISPPKLGHRADPLPT